MPNTRVLLIDLDFCLFHTPDMGTDFLRPVIATIRGRLSEELVTEIHTALWKTSFDDVIASFNVPCDLAVHMRAAWLNLRVPTHMKPYDDVVPVLTRLRTPDTHLALVTRGYQHLQQDKIQVLNLGPLFHTCIIVSPESRFRDKHAAFVHVLQATEGLAHAFVIGDGPEEIAAGNKLGTTSVQTLRPGVVRNDAAHHHVKTLWDLIPLL